MTVSVDALFIASILTALKLEFFDWPFRVEFSLLSVWADS